MAMELIRVDDRLIHGQVVVGWGSHLKPDIIILANDEIASSEEESELYLLAVPFEYEGKVLSLNELSDFTSKNSGKTIIIVIKSVKDAVSLYRSGYIMKSLNIGGLHSKTDKLEINHYIYIDKDDISDISYLSGKGVEVYIQDLPTGKRYGIDYILKNWEKYEKLS